MPMPQSRTSSIRYASRIGIGALTLALGFAALTAPAASATSGDTAAVTAQPSASASTDASSPAIQSFTPIPVVPLPHTGDSDDDSTRLYNGHIVKWTGYHITGDHEITFDAQVNSCTSLHAKTIEENGVLKVALIGSNPTRHTACIAVMRQEHVKVKTTANANTLRVQPLHVLAVNNGGGGGNTSH
jgi:hypothetical protein